MSGPPDPRPILADLNKLIEKLPMDIGDVDIKGLSKRLDETEARSRLMNLKLTLLLEKAGIDWQKDPRIEALKKR
jgi:hypothetical protein